MRGFKFLMGLRDGTRGKRGEGGRKTDEGWGEGG